jgi:hypothetical protein
MPMRVHERSIFLAALLSLLRYCPAEGGLGSAVRDPRSGLGWSVPASRVRLPTNLRVFQQTISVVPLWAARSCRNDSVET